MESVGAIHRQHLGSILKEFAVIAVGNKAHSFIYSFFTLVNICQKEHGEQYDVHCRL